MWYCTNGFILTTQFLMVEDVRFARLLNIPNVECYYYTTSSIKSYTTHWYKWWSIWESNPCPTKCISALIAVETFQYPIWWTIQDSNLWPPRCKRDALTSWANRPIKRWIYNMKINLLSFLEISKMKLSYIYLLILFENLIHQSDFITVRTFALPTVKSSIIFSHERKQVWATSSDLMTSCLQIHSALSLKGLYSQFCSRGLITSNFHPPFRK